MTKTLKPAKITHRTWALLQSGGIVRLSEGRSTLDFEFYRTPQGLRSGVFVMTGPRGEHRLDAMQTDAERLNEHWRQFVIANEAAR